MACEGYTGYTEQPQWQRAELMMPETQRQAEQHTARLLGGLAVRAAMEGGQTEHNNASSLMAAAQLAALGDQTGRAVIRANVGTDLAERLFKAKHQSKVVMQAVNGEFQQNGRKLVDIHRNTLQHATLNAEMYRRTKNELTNTFMGQELFKAGVLERYHALVFSPASTTMTTAEKQQYGFFTDTDSCSIQMITAQGSQITLSSAFVAGKATPTSGRHDIRAIQQLTERFGAGVQTSDGTDMLRHIFLIPKPAIQGIEDVVAHYDQAAGGTFYGLDCPRQDYRMYARQCQERQDGFGDMVELITNQLVAEASTFRTPMDAVLRLDKLSEQYSVRRAVADGSLDERVFGAAAAGYIQDARMYMDQGDMARATAALNKAEQTAVSSSCPLFKGGKAGGLPDGGGDESATTAAKEEESSGKKWMHCPFCNADVFDDPCATMLYCNSCTAMTLHGKVVSEGDGGKAAAKQKPPARQAAGLLLQSLRKRSPAPVVAQQTPATRQDLALAA